MIVPTHDSFKPFLRKAIISAVNQTLNHESYEVIIVSDYRCDQLDKLVKEYKLRYCFVDDNSLGSKLEMGIRVSNGNIVCFLEDDDEYVNSHLEHVLIALGDGEKVGFYRTNVHPIDEQGRPLDSNRVKEIKHSILISKEDNIRKSLKLLTTNQLKYFPSSMAIRKDVVEKYNSILAESEASYDNIIVYSALFSGVDMMFSGSATVLYRIHQSTSNISNRLFNDFKEYKKKYLERVMSSLKFISSISNTAEYKFMIQEEASFFQIQLDLLKNAPKKGILRDYSIFLRRWLLFPISPHLFLVVLLVFSLLVFNTQGKFYHKFVSLGKKSWKL